MYEYKCKILKIIDGDTVDIDIDLGFDVILSNQRVRLFGIDTPESRTRDLEEKKFGLLSKNYIKGYLPVGSIQVLVTEKDDDRGKFGRILGKFKVYDTKEDRENFLHEMMIRDHMAVEYFGRSKEDIQDQHMKNRQFLYEQMAEFVKQTPELR
jgi:micrococcal nuclease